LPLTGCLNGDVDVVIDDDGSGSVTVEVFPSGVLGDALGDVDLQQVVDVAATGADDVEFETFERDGRNGYRVTAEFDSYDEVLLALQGRAVVAGQPVGLLRSGELRELPDGGWELAADVAPVAEILGTPSLDGTSADLGALIQAAADPTSGTGLDLSITLPGRVTSSNADVVDGGTATWTLDSPDVPSTLRMRTEPDPLLTPVRLLVGGALLAILIGVVLAAWGASRQYRVSRRAKRRRAKDARFPGHAPVTGGWEPPAAPASAAGTGPAAAERAMPLPPLPTLPAMSPGSEPPSASDAPVATEVPAGWYADPAGGEGLRWWDGSDWTEHTR
jgi:hypothetical protein